MPTKNTIEKKPVDKKPAEQNTVKKPAEKNTSAVKSSAVEAVAELDNKLKAVWEHRRSAKVKAETSKAPPPAPVSVGPVGAIIDALVNTAPGKMLELTDLDRNQVSLIPQVMVIDDVWDYIEQITAYRTNSASFKQNYEKDMPATPDITSKFVLLLAQCRRSLGGKTKQALETLALADLERGEDEKDMLDGHGNFED